MHLVQPLEEPAAFSDPFKDLYGRYHFRLCRLAEVRFPDLESEDIAQEAMYRLLRTFERFDSRRDPWPYLSTICINVGKDLAERMHRICPWDEVDLDWLVAPAADESCQAWAGERWVQDLLSHLPAGPRRVLALHALEDMTISEIAVLLGRTDNAVRQLLFRARREARLLLTGSPHGVGDTATWPVALELEPA